MEVGVPAKGGVVELVCESGVESLVGVEVFVDKAVERGVEKGGRCVVEFVLEDGVEVMDMVGVGWWVR